MRLLLVLFVLTGIAGMHTIGHPVGADSSTAGHTSAAASRGLPEAEPADGGSDDWRVDDWRVDEQDTSMVMNPLNVCVAILVAGVLLLLVGVLGRMRRGDAHEHHVVSAFMRAGRGPPGFVRCGLTLADLSVQRT